MKDGIVVYILFHHKTCYQIKKWGLDLLSMSLGTKLSYLQHVNRDELVPQNICLKDASIGKFLEANTSKLGNKKTIFFFHLIPHLSVN